MTVETYKPDMYVRHPNKPQWGPGRILATSENIVTVVFRDDPDRGKRNIRVDRVSLEVIDAKPDPILDRLPALGYFEIGWRVGDPNCAPLWAQVAEEFNRLSSGRFHVTPSDSPFAKFVQLYVFGNPNLHYEWLLRTDDRRLDVALHAELQDQEESLGWMEPVATAKATIEEGVTYRFICGEFGNLSAQAAFTIPYEHGNGREKEVAPVAASVMALLIQRTFKLCPKVG